ncbi:MAG TPA: hypothetical protein VF798_05760 [Burkholderiaceae bacterium]
MAGISQLVVITTYFNPCRYQTRRKNYERFVAGIRAAGVACITVECAFGQQEFELQPAADILQIRCETLVWQKERLLNLAAGWLPPQCQYVAWLDCDILFKRKRWARDLVRVLQTQQVAQVFETCVRLKQGDERGGKPDIVESFASVMARQPDLLNAGRYDTHGHTGYGWAMRRALFDEIGLYEEAVSGSADHFMAHAIYGVYGFCVHNALKHDPVQIGHFRAWADRFHARVRGSLGVVRGEIEHLWHGELEHRRYFLRMHDITERGFDPYTDLAMKTDMPLEWHPAMEKPSLRDYFNEYFRSRKEDGGAPEAHHAN